MMKNKLRIVFAGTPDFAVPCLKSLLDNDFDVIAVFTQPDRPQGRGQKTLPSPVKKIAEQYNIPVFQPVSFKDQSAVKQLQSLNPDAMIVVAYGLLLPVNVLTIPHFGCINVHASLLPRWRGAAPIQRAILAGDDRTGITIMQMEQGLDTGPMLYKIELPITDKDTAKTLHDALSLLGANALIDVLSRLKDDLKPENQNNDLACYAPKITKSEAKIDWQQPANIISRTIRAFNPWPGAYTSYQQNLIKIFDGLEIESANKKGLFPGQIASFSEEGIDVQTSKNIFRITQLQLAGGRILTVSEFARGNPLKIKRCDQFD